MLIHSLIPLVNIAAQSSMCITRFNMLSEDSERDESALIRVKDGDLVFFASGLSGLG